MTTLEPYDIKDPAQLMREVADKVDLAEDTAWLAVVHKPSTAQRLVRVDPLPIPALLDDDDDISAHLRTATEALGLGYLPRVPGGPEHKAVTIVVRPGATLIGPNEVVWLMGWRYANHCQNVYTGDVIVVTEHGWLDWMTREAGSEPRMLPAA